MSTTSPTSSCSWLASPFNYTVQADYPFYNFSYYGTCCSQKSVDTLVNSNLEWVLNDNVEDFNKWRFLVQLLYCTPGACTDPPLWTNCSISSTSSSSTTSPSTTSKGSTSTASTVSISSTVSSSSSSVGTSTGTSETSGTSEATVTSETSPGSTEVGTTSVTTTTDGAASDTTTTTVGTTTDPTPSSSTVASSPGSTPDASTPTSTTTPVLSTVTSTSSPATSHEVSTTFVSDLASTIASTLSTILSSVTSTGPLTTLTTPLGSSTSGPTSSTSGPTSSTSGQTATPIGSSTQATGTSSTMPATTAATGPTTETAYTGPTADAEGVVFRNTTVNLLPNCTQFTVETLFFANGTTLRNTTVEFNACSSTSSLTTAPTTPEATTTYNWPTGGTTRTLPSGEIIISESLIAYKNCTTVLMQLIYNPSTNTSRTAITSDPEGCKTTTSTAPLTSTASPTAQTTTFNWPTGGTTRTLPSGDIILSESLIAYKNCTTVLMQLIFTPSTNQTRTETTTDAEGCKTSTTPMPSTTQTPTASSTAKTTTYNWPTGGTTRVLPSGEIIISESLIAYQNCTTVLMQLIFTPSTNQTRTETTTDVYGCKSTSSSSSQNSSKITTPMPSSTSATPTTTFPWPTGGTTRTLPSGEIIISESLTAYKNCTTVLMQLIYNPKTNTTRTETTSDAQGCKATSSSTKAQTTPTTPGKATTTFPWPTGGTTRTLPSGEIIISESLTAYKNCTTVLMQLIYNPKTNTTRTETTSDAEGCKTTPTTTRAPTTTTFNWPTGGTTRVLPSGEIIISESLTAYKNCTTVLMQLLFNPTTNTTRTETTSDAQGCKATSTKAATTTPSTTTKTLSTSMAPPAQTTTYSWPTGGTTRLLPSGEIILSESLIAYKNCTTVLLQLIYNPTTNTTRTETTKDEQGCKASSSSSRAQTTPMTTPSPPTTATTTFQWPTGGTTRTLPSGEIILSESLTAYPNCTTTLRQLILNPTTKTTRTETVSDAQGCKATSTSKTPTTPMSSVPTTTELPFTFPESKTTQILPSGEIILSESLTAYPNCTTTLRQLILNPTTNTTRTETVSDAQGCKATTTTKVSTPVPSNPGTSTTPPPATPTTAPTHCPALKLDMSNTVRPTFQEVKGSYAIGDRVVHMCKKRYAFEYAGQPLKIYQCMPTGKWAGEPEKCISSSRKSEL